MLYPLSHTSNLLIISLSQADLLTRSSSKSVLVGSLKVICRLQPAAVDLSPAKTAQFLTLDGGLFLNLVHRAEGDRIAQGAQAMASICCSPPLGVPADSRCRSLSRKNK